jgi:CheY-like chemotaxis protein
MAKRVLVVDDKQRNRNVIAELLADDGHSVDDAGNMSEALRLYDRNSGRYDCVITDLNMPDGDGIGLAIELRKRGYNGHIVLATGNPDDIGKFAENHGITHEQVREYVNEVMTKPLYAIRLLDALRL